MNRNKISLIIIIFLLLILGMVIIFYQTKKESNNAITDNSYENSTIDLKEFDNNPTNKDNVIINNNLSNPQTTPTQTTSVKYSDTPESKVLSEESPAYLTGFEKRSDGYYYLSFDYVQFGAGEGFVNENTKIRTFRTDPQMKVSQVDIDNSAELKTFSDYQFLLKKEGSHFVNPGLGGGRVPPNGYYYVTIKNGYVTDLRELSNQESDG